MTADERGRSSPPVTKEVVLQRAINRIRAQTYLEIGVASGTCFFRIRARKKIGVDPHPSADFKSALRFPFLRNSLGRQALDMLRPSVVEFYEMTSEEFFSKHAEGKSLTLDVAFIDGEHTYRQSLRDAEHCLACLNRH